uniref:Histidine--tRNA ligase n=1 Tax=candidate division WOR-3 bacterium TaxID=2052148 RepID=A0A7C4U8I4_UNCW3
MFECVKGTKDILPEETEFWQRLEKEIREICSLYNYKEIRIPTFERTELFNKSTGEDTDIVEKQMYTFIDKGGRSLSLKPEGTPSVVRALLQYSLHKKNMVNKFYYIERMFRQERPQKGRYREFTQFGIENIGSSSYLVDAEVILLGVNLLKRIELEDVFVRLNSLGCDKDRKGYTMRLKEYLQERKENLCDDCKKRIERNPLRVLDCKIDRDKLTDVPDIKEFLCEDCKEHFQNLVSTLNEIGVNFEIDKSLVRGLDYYTRTVFEFTSHSLGSQDAIGGGGRYDNLVKNMGGPELPACGFAMGMERIILLMKKNEDEEGLDFYICSIGEDASKKSFILLEELRKKGLKGEKDYLKRSLKSQMREAEKMKSKFVLIIGDDEISKGTILVKDMKTGAQEEIKFSKEEIMKRLKC